jgi:S1-C subfamily serine protease
MSTVVVSAKGSTEVLEKAVWLLRKDDGDVQGTGFAVSGLGILTAAHVLTPTTKAALPFGGIKPAAIKEIRKEDHVDVARIIADVRMTVQLKVGTAVNLKIGDDVRVLGFPLYRNGDSVHVQHGRITGFSMWHKVPHYIVDCAIVHGNSGGPVLNAQNEVIGIAVKGQGVPKRFGNDDELSRFVPIDFALIYLANAP